MWKGKLLELKDDIKELTSKIKTTIFKDIKKEKLTPLEFTILECIFNKKTVSGYDLIQYLNKRFAGTREAHSGTIYPILSKLKKDGFLDVKTVKSPLGPLKSVYFLTEAGESILKYKVGKNFNEQIKFVENFLIDLCSIYIQAVEESKRKDQLTSVQKLLDDTLLTVKTAIYVNVILKGKCPSCGEIIDKLDSNFCSKCGSQLMVKS